MSGLTNTQTGAVIAGALPIEFVDANGNTVEAGASNPLPVSGGGGGGGVVQYEKGTNPAVTTSVTDQGDYLPVQLLQTTLPKLAGSNGSAIIGKINIASGQTVGISGTVDISSLPAGNNNIGNVDVVSLPSLPAGTNNIGEVDIASIPDVTLAAGTNNIGDVDIASMPDVVLAAGTNNIGDVDVASLPSLPAGNNNIGNVDVVTLPSLPAGNNNIGNVDIASSLPAGNNNIGDVDVASMPAISFIDATLAQKTVNPIDDRLPVSHRPIDTVSQSIEGSIPAPGTPVVVLANTSLTEWWKIDFAGIDRVTQANSRGFAFGVDRVNSNTPIYFPECRVIPSTFNSATAPMEPTGGEFYLKPGDKLIVDSAAPGSFVAYISYYIIE